MQLKYRRVIVCKILDPVLQIVWHCSINNKVDIAKVTSDVHHVHFKTNINNVTPCIQLLADDFDIKFFPIHHFSVWHLLVSHG